MSTAAQPGLVEVRLLGLPLGLLARAREHDDELTREFGHIEVAESDIAPARLTALSQQLRARYSSFTAAAEQAIAAATERGDQTIDVSLRVPEDVADAARTLLVLLDEADEYCRTGDLLTLAPPRDVVTLRQWYLHQFIDQTQGSAPVSFEEYVADESSARD